MEKRFSKESKGSLSLQKRLAAESARKQSQQQQQQQPEHVPDLTDFMNDMFFGTVKNAEVVKKSYNLTGGAGQAKEIDDQVEQEVDDDDDDDGCVLDSPRSRSSNSRLTQEWLEEAKRMVASSPSRCDSPSRSFGSPRFAAAAQNQALAAASLFDRRDPLSRSARRHRSVESFSGEILSKSAKHSRSNSETLDLDSPSIESDSSPASSVHRWFSNILKPTNPTPPSPSPSHDTATTAIVVAVPSQTSQTLPPRQSVHRKSRFKTDTSVTQPQPIPPIFSRRTFKTSQAQFPGMQLLSPPKNLIESAHRRSISASTCSVPGNHVLSPPRNLVESAHRRSISSSTCSMDKIMVRVEDSVKLKDGEGGRDLNVFLREQRIKIEKILSGAEFGKAKIVLSGPSNSTSSMVAAICHAWLLENRIRNNKEGVDGEVSVVVPVMNVRRGRMWKQRQASWLFHHVGVDATTLLFADEVDLESLMMSRQLSMLVVGQDILKSDNEVGSQCTILTDNYCEDAYDLLQTPMLKKLLLAGILLDTQNLNASAKLSMTRDAEAVQLLLVGSAPNYRNALFDLLIQDQRETSFLEALHQNYGKPPRDSGRDGGAIVESAVSDRKSTSISHNEAIVHDSDKNSSNARSAKINTVSPKPAKQKPSPAQAPKAAQAQAAPDASRGKNKFFLAKWFGFGSK